MKKGTAEKTKCQELGRKKKRRSDAGGFDDQDGGDEFVAIIGVLRESTRIWGESSNTEQGVKKKKSRQEDHDEAASED